MYTAENAPGVAVLLSGDADVPGPLTGLPTHQDNLDTVIGRYSRLIVDVAKPRPSDITVNVSSKSIRGEVLRILAGVDGEIRRFIAQYVSAEIDSPKSQAAQVINVAEQLDSTWSGP